MVGTHELLGLGALLTRAWKAESLSLMAVSASFLNAFTCTRDILQSCVTHLPAPASGALQQTSYGTKAMLW